ncbi:hypothetical protein HAX54_005678 [Datura stramonium]|uniref:Uncharacterized protein n=1 Tax=Datura stramonium TaxID=4076 RepID=A0ABS8TAE3_DATST|nr:hypothetical protein [Datura stramonium]
MYSGTFMFGKPSVIVTTPELCRKVLMDDDSEQSLGFPKYILRATEKRANCETVKTTFEKWATTGESLQLLFEMKKPTFKVLMKVLIGGDQVADELLDLLFKENNLRFAGLHPACPLISPDLLTAGQ